MGTHFSVLTVGDVKAVPGQLRICSKLKTSMGHRARPCLKKIRVTKIHKAFFKVSAPP